MCKTEKSLTIKDLSCPNMLFLDSRRHLTGYLDKIEIHPVLDQKMVNSKKSNEDNIVTKVEDLKSFRKDLTNFVKNKYNYIVDNIDDLVNSFNKSYPGYQQVLGYNVLKDEVERLNSWGW